MNIDGFLLGIIFAFEEREASFSGSQQLFLKFPVTNL